MGLIINPKDQAFLERIAARERAPFYVLGLLLKTIIFLFIDEKMNETPIDLHLDALVW